MITIVIIFIMMIMIVVVIVIIIILILMIVVKRMFISKCYLYREYTTIYSVIQKVSMDIFYFGFLCLFQY